MTVKRLCSLFAMLCLFSYAAFPAQAQRSVSVQVDAQPLSGSCYVINGVTYVPLRTLLDALGDWTVWWDSTHKTAMAESEQYYVIADPDSDTVSVNGTALSGRVTVENGRTYIPLRLLCEALECTVVWDIWLDGAAVTSADAAYDAVELYWLSHIIYAESGAESLQGQIAVGNVVMNRMASKQFPDTVPAVIFDRVDGTQFEPVENGSVYQMPSAQAIEAARRVLDGENTAGAALYFYAPLLSEGIWINQNCTYLQTIGCHRFYI